MYAFIGSSCLLFILIFANFRDAARINNHKANLVNCDASDVLPGEYIVHLANGVTWKEHKQRLGHMFSRIRQVFEMDWSDEVWYSVEMEEKALAVIRADEDVEFVECYVAGDGDVSRKVESVLAHLRGVPREEL